MEVPDKGEITEVTGFWTWMGADGIVRTKVKPGADITLVEARENSEVTHQLFLKHGAKFPLLVDSSEIHSMSREARKFFSVSDRSTGINAMALLIGSPLSRIIVNFFMALQNQGVPCKVFTDEKKALKWLNQFM